MICRNHQARSESIRTAAEGANPSAPAAAQGPAKPPRWRRRVGVVGCVALLIALAGCVGCATVVVPPRAVQDPVTIHLADHGQHASLVLPRADGSVVEYAFGEWRWFALNDTGVRAAFRALAWRSAGTLGRRELPPGPALDADGDFAGVTLFALVVERQAVNDLLERLDERWTRQAHTAVNNSAYDLHFVRDEQAYHLFNNCNPAVAGWLRELGCHVRGPALQSKWRLRRAEPDR